VREGNVIKSELIKVVLSAFLLFSVLNVVIVLAQCPTCGGTGEIACPYCNGYGYILNPKISTLVTQFWTNEGGVIVEGTFKNEEDIGVYGTAVAEVYAGSKTYTKSGSPTYLPPNEKTKITIRVDGISYNDYRILTGQRIIRGRMTMSDIDDIPCPYCDGTGVVPCPDCGRGGDLTVGERSTQKEDTTTSFAVDWTIVGGVGVVATGAIAAVLVVKRKKVTENDLRKLTSLDFRNWVVQRLSGKASSLRDSRIGIDAYTAEGHPVQIIQSDNIGRNTIEGFASVMGRVKAKNGVIIAFSFADDSIRGIVRARINYGVEIKKVTVKELIQSKGLAL
jgi:hypothetical protein